MPVINKANETMGARKRVLNTFLYEKTDRVTIGFDSNPAIYKKLCLALGIKNYDYLDLCRALGVDYLSVNASYKGPILFENNIPNRTVDPVAGFITRRVEHKSGVYEDYCDFPLKDADDEAFFNYPMPSPDDFDYDGADAAINTYSGEFAVHLGHPGVGDIINSCGMLMGMEDMYFGEEVNLIGRI